MGFRSRSRPSVAVAIAVLALSVGLVGTAVGGTDQLTKVTTPKVRKIAKKQANKAIKKQAPALAVGAAGTANEATHAATAGVFAHVNAGGAVDASRAVGFDGVTVAHPEAGVYCFSGFGFEPRSIDGTVDSGDGPGIAEASVIPSNFVTCPRNAQAELVTFTSDTVTFQDFSGGFYVRIY